MTVYRLAKPVLLGLGALLAILLWMAWMAVCIWIIGPIVFIAFGYDMAGDREASDRWLHRLRFWFPGI